MREMMRTGQWDEVVPCCLYRSSFRGSAFVGRGLAPCEVQLLNTRFYSLTKDSTEYMCACDPTLRMPAEEKALRTPYGVQVSIFKILK